MRSTVVAISPDGTMSVRIVVSCTEFERSILCPMRDASLFNISNAAVELSSAAKLINVATCAARI